MNKSRKVLITNIIYKEKPYLFCGLTVDGKLLEARLESQKDARSGPVVGEIYIAKVQRVMKNLNAAFVEIAPGMACYLPAEPGKEPVYLRKQNDGPMVAGDELLVQIRKDAIKQKQPGVSVELTLTGRYVVLVSGSPKINVSRKLPGNIRESIREAIQAECSCAYEIIVRTNASQVPVDEILKEITRLEHQMNTMLKRSHSLSCYSRLYEPPAKFLNYVQGSYSAELEEIVTDLPEIFKQAETYITAHPDMSGLSLRLYQDPLLSLAGLYNINRQLEAGLNKKVWMRSGGFLVIEPTEAMTVIDVNTGKSASRKDFEEHIFRTNLEAAEEIAYQIRLRNISGIIIVDFISMADHGRQEQLLKALRAAVSRDPIPVNVVDITRLQLVEMTRKKVEKSLHEQLT